MTTSKTVPDNNCTTDTVMLKQNEKAKLIEEDHLKNGHTLENTNLPDKDGDIDKVPITEEPKEKPPIIVEPSANNKK